MDPDRDLARLPLRGGDLEHLFERERAASGEWCPDGDLGLLAASCCPGDGRLCDRLLERLCAFGEACLREGERLGCNEPFCDLERLRGDARNAPLRTDLERCR